jgi:D-3-phosphoglycerate dehydrogenase
MPLFKPKETTLKVLVPEKLSPDGLALLRSSLDVDERKGLTPDHLLEIIPNYDALLVRSETKVTATVLRAARRLKVVARAGVGVDNVGKLIQRDPPQMMAAR